MSDLEVVLPEHLEEAIEEEKQERSGRSKSEITRSALEEYFMRRGLL
jgi:metal-responsive CopG/Arc/MetJ family transcriptional regulator